MSSCVSGISPAKHFLTCPLRRSLGAFAANEELACDFFFFSLTSRNLPLGPDPRRFRVAPLSLPLMLKKRGLLSLFLPLFGFSPNRRGNCRFLSFSHLVMEIEDGRYFFLLVLQYIYEVHMISGVF